MYLCDEVANFEMELCKAVQLSFAVHCLGHPEESGSFETVDLRGY